MLYYRGVHNIYCYKTPNYGVVSVTSFWQERSAVAINLFKILTGYISHCIQKLLTFMYIWCLIHEATQYCAVYNKNGLHIKTQITVQYTYNLWFMLPTTNVKGLIPYLLYILPVRVQKQDGSCILEMLLYYSISSRIVLLKIYHHTVWHLKLK